MKKVILITIGIFLGLAFLGRVISDHHNSINAPSTPEKTSDEILVEKTPGANAAEKRKKYADRFETEMLKKGQNYFIKAKGKENTVLEIEYILMGRPLVFQILTNAELMDTWKAFGFKKIVLTDGRDYTINHEFKKKP